MPGVARAAGRTSWCWSPTPGLAVVSRRAGDRERAHARLRRQHQPRRRRDERAVRRRLEPGHRGDAGSIATLHEFAETHPRAGIVGPQLRYPDGRWQPSRRRFPTVSGTIVRRTPLRRLLNPERRQRRHYLLDERPSEPDESDWLLGAFLFLRRELLEELGGLDEGYRLYGDDIDLATAPQGRLGALVRPDAVVIHHHQAVTDHRFFTRRTLWHWRSIARFVRKHPESLRRSAFATRPSCTAGSHSTTGRGGKGAP